MGFWIRKIGMSRKASWARIIPGLLLISVLVSCSHDYDSDTLDLGKYQWNMWPEEDVQTGPDELVGHEPSCGWDVLHRGMGKLVRIPATLESSFKPEEQSSVAWFHCRHTLPELWAEREISLKFEGVSHEAEVYLNGELVGTFLAMDTPYTIDISDKVYYVRDNHLVVRVYDPDPASCGISGNILVVSTPPDQVPRN